MRMALLAGAVCATALCLAGLTGVRAQEPAAQSEIELAAPGAGISVSQDFGHTLTGSAVSFTFTINNPSATDIRVNDSHVSCGCLSVVRKPSEIVAGRSAEFELKLETDGRHGRVIQTATFELSHPRYKYLRLRLSGVADGVWAQPLSLDFGTVQRGSVNRRFFQAFQSGRENVRITKVEADSDQLKLTAREVEGEVESSDFEGHPLQHVDIAWTPGAADPIGPFRSRVRLHTNDSKFPVIEVNVTAHVVGEARVRPSPIVFGAVTQGAESTRRCRIVFAEAVDETKIRFHATHPDVSCTIRHTGISEAGEQSLELLLAFRPGAKSKAGLLKGYITAQDVDETTVVSFPYMGFVRTSPHDQ